MATPTAPTKPEKSSPARIDFRRYRKLRRFVARTFLSALWWDFVLGFPPLSRLRPPALGRWVAVARRYRALAVDMGGVLIKLGQFLSVRVDLLPPEVVRELAGLQDEVPPERFADVVRQVEEDFGRPLSEVFARFDPEPVGAASLAQVHRARLARQENESPTEEDVVVKVLRPGIDLLVETDLAAARLAIRLLKVSRKVRRRVDLDRLAEEFAATTRRELDMTAEGRNAERFAADFAGDGRVHVPRVYWQRTAARTLTLEDVGYLKVSDLPALAAAGIRHTEVARVLYRIYMQQIFVHHFVHADPHPGNLFVKPLPGPDEAPFRPGEPVPFRPERGFQIVFVDFGMVAMIPERLREPLREYVIALGTRDAVRIVHAYARAGVLLPGADLTRLEAVHQELFDRFWGVSIGQLRDVALSEASYFLREYRDLLYEIPFQVQVDLLFTSRAVGLLSGLATTLDPEFDPWAETIPFAERFARDEIRLNLRQLLAEAASQGRVLLGLPKRIDDLITRAERGELAFQAALTPETRKFIGRLERSAWRLAWMVVTAGLLIAAAMLHVDAPQEPYDHWLAALAALAFLWGVVTKH